MSKGKRAHVERDVVYHEAGHAAVSVLLRRTVKTVTIVEDEDSRGYVLHPYAPEHISEDMTAGVYEDATRRWLFRDMVICYAGYLAEARVCNLETTDLFKGGSSEDWGRLADFAVVAWGTDRDEDHQEKVDQSHEEAEKLLDAHWEAVEAVAMELLKKKTLIGRRVREIVFANGGRQYSVKGGRRTSRVFVENEAGESVRGEVDLYNVSDLDREQVVWEEEPMTVVEWGK